MRKKLGIVSVLIFVLSFGSLVFAQNSNSSTTEGPGSMASSGGSMTGRRHGRRRGRRHGRRRGRRGGRRHSRRGGAAKTGNANM